LHCIYCFCYYIIRYSFALIVRQNSTRYILFPLDNFIATAGALQRTLQNPPHLTLARCVMSACRCVWVRAKIASLFFILPRHINIILYISYTRRYLYNIGYMLFYYLQPHKRSLSSTTPIRSTNNHQPSRVGWECDIY